MKSSKQLLILTAFFAASCLLGKSSDELSLEIDNIKKQISTLHQKTEVLEKSSLNGHSQEQRETFFKAEYDNVKALSGVKYTQEMFTAQSLNFLNNSISNDSAIFFRATADYYIDFLYGKDLRPKLIAHNTFRFRYKWGSGTEVKVFDTSATVVDASFNVKGTQANKHLLWSRESWLKLALGDTTKANDHFIQLGVFPYQAGRGISFGPAYQVGGFLGFTPGFSVDQFAPGFLLHINPVPEKVYVEAYLAMLENVNTSFKSNNEEVRKKEIDACPQRGTGRQSYAAVLKSSWDVISNKKQKLTVEPYIVYFQSLDQKFEFANDQDSFLTTYGLMLEGKYGKFDWGFEAAFNQGDILVKPWDRNTISFVKDDNGFIKEQYTKVFTDDPAISSSPTKADVTKDYKKIVDSSSKSVDINGKQIASSGLYNAYDRFRPKQNIDPKGYFFIADASYQCIDKVLNVAVGAGYASGNINQQADVNKLQQSDLLNQSFDGFVTLQSVYSGKRLRHLIIFNQGVPRFTSRRPGMTFSKQNVNPSLSKENIEFTNIAFVGSRAEWKVQCLKNYKVTFAPNVICYWAAEVPETSTGSLANNFMGTELTAEVSAYVLDRLKLFGYFGVLLPGGYYKDMCGTLIDKQKTGSDIATILNIGMSFAF